MSLPRPSWLQGAGPDLPGHGRSAGQPLASIEALAAWVVALLDAAGLRTAALVGHSMASLIALQAAAEAGERIRALALLGSVVPMPVAEPLLDAASSRRDKAHAMINQWSTRRAARSAAAPSPERA